MNEEEFKILEDIRCVLTEKRHELLDLEETKCEYIFKEELEVLKYQTKLNNKVNTMLRDKELRKTHNRTNQTDWKNKIKELLKKEFDGMDEIQQRFQVDVNTVQSEINRLKIRIKDYELMYRTKLAYYSNKEVSYE